jgi:diguanylate cyclase (GGDEF)-like protein
VDLFSDHLQNFVTHDGMLYRHDPLKLSHKQGTQARHRCTYTLNIGDEPLGELVFCRSKKFTTTETSLMEDYLCYLLYPLRNALLYQEALNLAQKDPLTGVYNRAALDEALEREISFARRQSGALSLVVLDIDHFKTINDQYGHIIGDCVLKSVVEQIQGCMRSTDQLFRYGGEEFVVLTRNTDARGACLLAERIRKTVEESSCSCSGAEIPVTLSAGVSTLRDHDLPVTLFAHADQALYLAKDRGRNQVRCSGQDS